MGMGWMLVAVAAGFIAGAVCAPPVEACSCDGVRNTIVPQPPGNTRQVPTNTRLWVQGDNSPVQLVGGDGHVVDCAHSTIATHHWGNLDVFTPAEELHAFTQYTGGHWRFVTGAGPDDDRPPVPVVGKVRLVSTPVNPFGCYPQPDQLAFISVEGSSAITVLDADDEADLEPQGPSGGISDVSEGNQGFAFSSMCGGEAYRFGPVLKLRVGAFDLAGNFSGWSASQSHFMPPAGVTQCACSQPGGTEGWPPWVSLCFALCAASRARSRANDPAVANIDAQ